MSVTLFSRCFRLLGICEVNEEAYVRPDDWSLIVMMFFWLAVAGAADQITVLDFNLNTGLVAYKSVFTSSGYEEAVDCHYRGLKETPFAQVELGLFDTKNKGRGNIFVIYPQVSLEEECKSHADSMATLNAAKRLFSTVGLDLSKPPKLSEQIDKNGVISLDWKGKPVEIKPVSVIWTDGEALVKRDDSWDPENWTGQAMSNSAWSVNGFPFFELWRSYTTMMAGRFSAGASQAFIKGDALLFQIDLLSSNMRGEDLASYFVMVDLNRLSITPPKIVRPNLALSYGMVDRFEVLGINPDRGLAAVKVISHTTTSKKCAYAGMEKYANSGVALGLWDLKGGTLVSVWDVYQITDETHLCSTAEHSKKELAAAKKRFLKEQLPIDQAVQSIEAQDGVIILPNGLNFRLKEGVVYENELRHFHVTDETGASLKSAYIVGDQVFFAWTIDNDYVKESRFTRWVSLKK